MLVVIVNLNVGVHGQVLLLVLWTHFEMRCFEVFINVITIVMQLCLGVRVKG